MASNASKTEWKSAVRQIFTRLPWPRNNPAQVPGASEELPRIDAENYRSLITALAEEIHAKSGSRRVPSIKLTQARHAYLERAIARGTVLNPLPEGIETWSPSKLAAMSAQLADKPGTGMEYGSKTGFALADREALSEAAERRPPERQWDNIFPAGQNDVLLDFLEGGRSTDKKLDDYLQRHNAAAGERFREASIADALAKENDPNAHAKAGRKIDQRQIRIDPEHPDRLQTCNPTTGGWENGPRINKFLQDHYEWELFDILQREKSNQEQRLSRSSANAGELRATAFRAMLDHESVYADALLNRGLLRVLISRDPQKIGEMSTGQRWESCMALHSINYPYVLRDIEAGSLVGYVVHKDDPEGRYPLMRQMLKPFEGAEGKVILVPAKIYNWGLPDATSQTEDALNVTLTQFAARFNADCRGIFTMSSDLYYDGAAGTVNIQERWPEKEIQDAVRQYRSGALQEWFTELDKHTNLLTEGRRGAHGEDPAEVIPDLLNKIRRAFNHIDEHTGLPRMFYREMLRTSVGTVPSPEAILIALHNDASYQEPQRAFDAFTHGEQHVWAEIDDAPMHTIMHITRIAAAVNAIQGEKNCLPAWLSPAAFDPERIVPVVQHLVFGPEFDFQQAEQRSYLSEKNCRKNGFHFEGEDREALRTLTVLVVNRSAPEDADLLKKICAFAATPRPDLYFSTEAQQSALRAVWEIVPKRRNLADGDLLNQTIEIACGIGQADQQEDIQSPMVRLEALQFTIGAIVTARPDLLDSSSITRITDLMANDHSLVMRECAANLLGRATDLRPDLITPALLDRTVDIAKIEENESNRWKIHDVLSGMVDKRPDLNNASSRLFLGNSKANPLAGYFTASDADTGFDWDLFVEQRRPQNRVGFARNIYRRLRGNIP